MVFADYEKMFCVDLKNGDGIFDLHGINRDEGSNAVCGCQQLVFSNERDELFQRALQRNM